MPAPRTLFFSRSAVIAAASAALVLLLSAAGLTLLSTHDLALADRQATHSRQTLAAAHALLDTTTDAAVSARRALLAADDVSLRAYTVARGRYRRELADLRTPFDGQEGLATALAALQALTEQEFLALDRGLARGREGDVMAGLRVIESDGTAHLLEDIRRLVAMLQREEFARFTDASALATGRAQIIGSLNTGLFTLAAVLALGAVWWWRRTRQRDGLITVCAWTRRVKWDGQWLSFEEYLSHRFNLRCTHGICDEAAAKLKRDAAPLPKPRSSTSW